MRIPFYEKPQYPFFSIDDVSQIHMMEIVNFLKWVIDRDQLEIANYFEEMGQDPFFLVAATGLGKTVGVPIHVLIRQIQHVGQNPDPKPRVWIIEPRIPIAISQAAFMNMLWKTYMGTIGKKRVAPLFGCISSTSGNVNPEAPIKFVTTGIFELMAKDGELSPARDRVVIDEAHVTVEQNPGVELGIALARQAGIVVDYMSATVDTANLREALGVTNIIQADKQRFVVWKHNLMQPTAESLPDLVANTLVSPNLASEYFPQPGEFKQADEVRLAVTEHGRSHGMLVVVNSFAGNYSDTQRLARIVRRAHPSIAVLQLASEVIRDPKRMAEYGNTLKEIERRKENYIVFATSVVEMGITFPTLDYVVTMDCGYEQETIGDVTFPVVAPLGVNSLLQRVGRVGRKRPGIAYIANEVSADYAELEDDALNGKQALAYEPISFPLGKSTLTPLAFYACAQRWEDINAQITALNLPSQLQEYPERMEYLHEQLAMLHELGLAYKNKLTHLGKNMEKWIGQADLAYAVQLQKCTMGTNDTADVVFWIVLTALSNTPIVTLRAPHDYFIDRDGSYSELPHSIDVWSHEVIHEDASAFVMFARAASLAPNVLFGAKLSVKDETDEAEFRRWCGHAGIDARKLIKAGQAVQDTWRLLSKISDTSERYQTLFKKDMSLRELPWQTLAQQVSSRTYVQLYSLAGSTKVQFTFNSAINSYDWTDTLHGHTGTLSQDDTPVPIKEGVLYTARVIPGRKSHTDDVQWSIAHLGQLQPPKRQPKERPTAKETRKRPRWLEWLFS